MKYLKISALIILINLAPFKLMSQTFIGPKAASVSDSVTGLIKSKHGTYKEPLFLQVDYLRLSDDILRIDMGSKQVAFAKKIRTKILTDT